MASDYLLLLRNQDNQIFGAIAHNQAAYIEELSVLHGYLLHNVKFGAVRAEVHSFLPEETLSQAIDRIADENPRPLTTVTKDDLSAQELEEHV